MWKKIYPVLDGRVANILLVAVLLWALFDTGLLAAGEMLHFGGLGYGVALLVAALWVYSIVAD